MKTIKVDGGMVKIEKTVYQCEVCGFETANYGEMMRHEDEERKKIVDAFPTQYNKIGKDIIVKFDDLQKMAKYLKFYRVEVSPSYDLDYLNTWVALRYLPENEEYDYGFSTLEWFIERKRASIQKSLQELEQLEKIK